MANHNSAQTPADKTVPILITGAHGFIGRNLTATLRAEGYTNLMLCDVDTQPQALSDYVSRAAFVFHLAGVNRPKETDEFYSGNIGFTQHLLSLLSSAKNTAPILLSSSSQVGNGSDYALSKEQAETAVFSHGKAMQSPAVVYRLPGVFGKWCRPSYNSVVATFCHNIARGLPIEVHNPATSFPLCYIDDVVRTFIDKAQSLLFNLPPCESCGDTEKVVETRSADEVILGIDPTYEVTLGWLAGVIRSFPRMRQTLSLPDTGDACTSKLWATYLSFLPTDGFSYPLTAHSDDRGSFTEFIRTYERGQVSVNITKPGITKGNHWHNTKNEKFFVVAGSGLIRLRAIGCTEVIEYAVQGTSPQVVEIPPGYTHNISNVGAEDLVTIMWVNEPYTPDAPDTYYEEV